MTYLHIVRGLPGSAKTTTAKMLLCHIRAAGRECNHYEADMFFMKNGEYQFDINYICDAHDWCQDSTWNSLSAGVDCIVSNTFTTIREIRPYFEMAKELKIIPNVITCQSNFGSIHGVPSTTVEKMKTRFTYDIQPLFDFLKNED